MNIGGIAVTCEQAAAAVCVLSSSGASAIKAILRAARNPLWECDYWAVCRPGYAASRQKLAKTGRIGPRGRHLAKDAFCLAVGEVIVAAAHAELDTVLEAFGADERYYAAVAADAVAYRTREHTALIRARARAMVTAAVEQCAAPGTCSRRTACGTGTCPFASPELRDVIEEAGPGRIIRPAGHAEAGTGFSDAAAAAWLAEKSPWRPSVHIGDGESCPTLDDVAA